MSEQLYNYLECFKDVFLENIKVDCGDCEPDAGIILGRL